MSVASESAAHDRDARARLPRGRRVLVVLASSLALPLVPFLLIGELPGERWLAARGTSSLTFGAVGAGLLAADVLLPVPSSIVGTLLGARLGVIVGALGSLLGLVLGSVLGYGVGRGMLSRLVPAPIPARPMFLAVLVSRPVPVLAEALAFAAGAARVPFAHFLLASLIGNGAYALALAGAGAALVPGGWAGPALAVPLAVPVVGWLSWRVLARRRARALSSGDAALRSR